jgi:hypothetical protein
VEASLVASLCMAIICFEYGRGEIVTPSPMLGPKPKKIASIWSSIIHPGREIENTGLVDKYVDLIINQLHTAADVYIIDSILDKGNATAVWNTLRDRAQRSSQFYYCANTDPQVRLTLNRYMVFETDRVQDYEIITRRLKITPVSLDSSFWELLRRYKLCSTPKEECLRRFRKATTAAIVTNIFSQHVIRALRALMAQETSLSNLEIIPVNSDDLGIVANYHNGQIKIDQKWFTYPGAHESGYCEHESEGPEELKKNFSCDHVIIFLWEQILKSIRDEGSVNLQPSREAFLCNVARTKVQQIPRAITFHTNAGMNKLYIRWTSMEPHKNADKPLLVTLHKPTCELEKELPSVLLYKKSAGMSHSFHH